MEIFLSSLFLALIAFESENTFYNFNSFKSFEVNVMAQNEVSLGECSTGRKECVFCCWLGGCSINVCHKVLYPADFLSSSLSIERGVLKSPTICRFVSPLFFLKECNLKLFGV